MHCGLRHYGAGLLIWRRDGLLYRAEQDYSHGEDGEIPYRLGVGAYGIVYPMYDYMLYQSCT